jgi:hypothetical protein
LLATVILTGKYHNEPKYIAPFARPAGLRSLSAGLLTARSSPDNADFRLAFVRQNAVEFGVGVIDDHFPHRAGRRGHGHFPHRAGRRGHGHFNQQIGTGEFDAINQSEVDDIGAGTNNWLVLRYLETRYWIDTLEIQMLV